MRVLVITSLGAAVLAGSTLHCGHAGSTIVGRELSSFRARNTNEINSEHQIQGHRLTARIPQRLETESPFTAQIRRASIVPEEKASPARLTRRMISRQMSSSTPGKVRHSYSESNINKGPHADSETISTKSKSLSQLLSKPDSRESSPWRHGPDPFQSKNQRSSLDHSPPRKTNSQGSFRDDSPWRHGGGAVHDSAPIRHSILGFNPADPHPPLPRTSSSISDFKAGSLSRASSLLRTASPLKIGGLSRGGSFAREGKDGKLSRTVSFAHDIATPFGASSPGSGSFNALSSSPSGRSRDVSPDSSSGRGSKGLSRSSSLAGPEGEPSEPRTPVAGFRAQRSSPQTPTTPVTPSTPLQRWKSGL